MIKSMTKSKLSIIWLVVMGILPAIIGAIFSVAKSTPTMDSVTSAEAIVSNVPQPPMAATEYNFVTAEDVEELESAEHTEVPVDYMAELKATEPLVTTSAGASDKAMELEIRKFEEQVRQQRISQTVTIIGTFNTMAMSWVTLFYRRREKEKVDDEDREDT